MTWNKEDRQRALRFRNLKLGQKVCVTVGQEVRQGPGVLKSDGL